MYNLRPRTTFTGRLTQDAELRELPSGDKVCELRIAYDQRSEKQPTGYFNVSVFGAYGETCAKLTKGQLVGVQGRIEYREWESGEGARRSAHHVVAEEVSFLSRRAEEASAPEQAHPVAA